MSVIWKCDRSLVEPQLADDIDAELGPDPATWIVHDGKRSDERQWELWKQGRETPGPIVTYAKPDQDPHVGRGGKAYAIDFHELTDGKDDWTVGPNWRRIMAKVDAHPRLHGGWHFPHPDNDHIQSLAWYKVRAELAA